MIKKWLLTGATVLVTILASVLLFYWITTPCLFLNNGDTGDLIKAFPIKNGDEFSITFVHSVNKSPVTDVYQILGDKIYVVRTVYYSFGAGVQTEIEEGQTLVYGQDGSMIVSGFNQLMDHLSYIVGTVSDHTLLIGGETVSLRELCGRNTTVQFTIGRRPLFHINTGSK